MTNLDLWHNCGGKFQHVDEQDNGDGTITDEYQCDGCQVWRSVTWDKETEEVLSVEEEAQDKSKSLPSWVDNRGSIEDLLG
jgi:hypothetical protein